MSFADFSKRLAPAARSRLKARIEAVLAGRGRKARLATDYAYFAPECLKIRAKAGSITPFCFNRAQLFIHARLAQQRAATGRVRALILKGRQQGCSTYVGGRFYHRAIHGRGLRVFILTHEDPATQNLFDMVDRFHAHCPAEIRPVTGHANAKELSFDALDSGYRVATAATKGAGRSSTVQLFHGSEVAFWPNADSHAAGVLQAVPDMPDTEVILESTAQFFSRAVARGRGRQQRLRRDLRAVVLAGRIPQDAAGGFRARPGRDRVSPPLRPRPRPDGVAPRQDRRAARPGLVQAGISR